MTSNDCIGVLSYSGYCYSSSFVWGLESGLELFLVCQKQLLQVKKRVFAFKNYNMYFGRIQLLSIRLEGGNARAQLQEEEVKPVCSFLLLVMWTFLVCYLSFFRLLCREEVKEDHPDGWKIWNTSPRDHTTKARSFLSGSLVFFPNHKLAKEIQLCAVQRWYFSILISKYLLCMVNASMVTVKCLVCIWKRRL